MSEKKIGIVIDTLGSDKGPESIILGASMALTKYENIKITLVGDIDLINEKIKELSMDSSRIEIVDAKETITNYDNPTQGIFTKPNASIIQAMKYASSHDDCEGVINCGSTGAVLVCSFRYLSDEKKTRPCLAAVLPHQKNGYVAVVDTGATIDCTSSQLHEFALLGSDLMKKLYQIENPRVGLLSNGSEPTKGNKLGKETFPILEADERINFVGNIEGNKSLSGECDVLVCDGFAGNQVLKNSEGMAKMLIKDLIVKAKKDNMPEFMNAAMYLMQKYDFNSMGGAIILGTKKPVLKGHGASDENTIVSMVSMMIKYANGEAVFTDNI